MMTRCPGCGGRNPRDATSCDWCHRSFLKPHRRGLSARWWGLLSAGIIGALLVAVAALAVLNTSRGADRAAASATPSPPPLPPFQATVPSPVGGSPTAAAAAPLVASPRPSPTPAPAYARIANTNSLGANIRREPAASSPPVTAVPEEAVVRLLGPEASGVDGRLWRQVEDGGGHQGWVPADFLVPTAAPAGR